MRRSRGEEEREQRVSITSVRFQNFKTFKDYSFSINRLNILVGPNNSGKSTIISAFRALEAGLRRAAAKNQEVVPAPKGRATRGYLLAKESLPLSIENVHTDYSETDTSVTFRLSNGNHLLLFFPPGGGCCMIPDAQGHPTNTTSQFSRQFPITVRTVPILGPIEHEEDLLQTATVQRNLATHRASQNFRNFWFHYQEGFADFSKMVAASWPGMEIAIPALEDPKEPKLTMFCKENRLTRELFWAGFGFQIWCQLLTHMSRSRAATTFVVDEAETYLHPEVQRHLLALTRDLGPDVIMATHSTEILSEADPSEVVLVDKTRNSAKPLRDIEGIQEALGHLGSIHNITLSQLAQHHRIVFVEGPDDLAILKRFAKRLGHEYLAATSNFSVAKADGFSAWKRIRDFRWGLKKTVAKPIAIAAVFDRDFFCDEEISAITKELAPELKFLHIHSRKEIENFLLEPDVLARAMEDLISERADRLGEKPEKAPDVKKLLRTITDPLKDEVFSKLIDFRLKFHHRDKSAPPDDPALIRKTLKEANAAWADLDGRLAIVPGKAVLGELRSVLHSRHRISLTNARIISHFRTTEIPKEIVELLGQFEALKGK